MSASTLATSPGRRRYSCSKARKRPSIPFIRLYSQKITVPLEARTQRVSTDKVIEYTSGSSQGLCNDSGIVLGFATTAIPQQVGASEGDGRAISMYDRKVVTQGR